MAQPQSTHQQLPAEFNHHFISRPVSLSAEEAKKLLKNHLHFLSTPNVVSLDYCNEKINGKKTDRKVFRIGVIQKLAPEEISEPDILLPKTIKHRLATAEVDIPVKIVEEGVIEAIAAPYKGGGQIKAVGVGEQGSLGVNINYNGEYRLLSAAHVLTKFNADNVGKPIMVRSNPQEAWKDLGSSVEGQVAVQMYDSPTAANPVMARQDLAWAKVTKEQASPEIETIGAVDSIRLPLAEEKVKIFGGHSRTLKENIEVDSINLATKIPFQDAGGQTKYIYFKEVCLINQMLPFGPGDSGSAVIAESDNKVVGILFAMGQVVSIFCKLD